MIGTYLHGPLLPKNAWFADWLIAHRARPAAAAGAAGRRARGGCPRRCPPSGRAVVRLAPAPTMLAVRLRSMHSSRRHATTAIALTRSRCCPRAGPRPRDSPHTLEHARARRTTATTTSNGTTTALPGSRQAAGDDRRQELHRAVRARRALLPGAEGAGLQRRAQPQHRPDRGHDPGARERPARHVSRVPADLGPDDRRRAAAPFARAAAAYRAGQRYALDHGSSCSTRRRSATPTRSRSRVPTPTSTICGRSQICAGWRRR